MAIMILMKDKELSSVARLRLEYYRKLNTRPIFQCYFLIYVK